MFVGRACYLIPGNHPKHFCTSWLELMGEQHGCLGYHSELSKVWTTCMSHSWLLDYNSCLGPSLDILNQSPWVRDLWGLWTDSKYLQGVSKHSRPLVWLETSPEARGLMGDACCGSVQASGSQLRLHMRIPWWIFETYQHLPPPYII